MEIYIPTNYTDAGKLLGMFEIRNCIEALVLCLPVVMLLVFVSPFGLMGTTVMISVAVVIIGGFALIGIHDYSLLTFLRIYHRYRKSKRILTYRGITWENTKEKKKSRKRLTSNT